MCNKIGQIYITRGVAAHRVGVHAGGFGQGGGAEVFRHDGKSYLDLAYTAEMTTEHLALFILNR